jgi:selenocysteine lyase/cysteine desulfurase
MREMEADAAARLFEIPSSITYLNLANLSPQLQSVTQAGIDAVRSRASPWTMTGENWFSSAEQLRALMGELLGTPADAVALVPAVSYGMAVAAANVPIRPGSSIVLLDQDFPSNVYTWREAARKHGAEFIMIPRDPSGWTEPLLRAITPRTAVVCVPPCHFADGTTVDLERVSRRTHQVGAALIVDATQALGAMPLDLAAIDPDFLLAAGFKWLLGAYGLTYLYASPRWQATGVPIEQTWASRKDSHAFHRLTEYRDDLCPGARRFDAGAHTQFMHTAMCAAALRQVLSWSVASIQASLAPLVDRIAACAELAGYQVAPAAERARHMIGIRFRDGLPPRLAPALATAQVYASIRGDALRISPYLYNTHSDIDRLFATIAVATGN